MLWIHVLIFLDLLRPCKITKIKFSSKQKASRVSSVRLNENLKNRVRTWWMYIGSSLPSDSIGLTSFQKGKAVLGIGHNVFWLALYEYACVLVFSDVEGFGPLLVLKKIEKFLVIDL
jgi:hypothetical protein